MILNKYFSKLTSKSSVLGQRIFVRTLNLLVLVTLATLVSQFCIQLNNLHRNQVLTLESSLEALLPSISRSVWQYNEEAVEVLLSSFSLQSYVKYAYLDTAEQRFVSLSNDAMIAQRSGLQPLLEHEIERTHSTCDHLVVNDLSNVSTQNGFSVEGKVYICYMQPPVDTQFITSVLLQYLPHLLEVIIIAFMFMLIILRTVVLPLSMLTKGLSNKRNVLDLYLDRNENDVGDEIDQLLDELKYSALAEQKEKDINNATLNLMIDGLAITDSHFNILRENEGVGRLLGKPAGDKEILSDFVTLESIAAHHGKVYEFEHINGKIIEVIGARIDYQFQGVNPDAEYVFVLKDITEKRRLLEQAIQNQKIQAVGTFSSGLAHDFNNILMVVRGVLELFSISELSKEKYNELLQGALTAVENGQELTSELLLFSRKQKFINSVIHVDDIANNIQILAKSSLDPTINLIVDIRSSNAVFADQTFLDTALLNLIFNARDAMPYGGDIILCIYESHRKNKDCMVFDVIDTGEGIPSDIISEVCIPYYTTKKAGKGTGLGLAMVAGFASESGGEFVVRSHEGEGTTASIILPIEKERSSQKIIRPSLKDTNSIKKSSQDKQKILIIDDNREICNLLKMQLEAANYSVIIAHSVVNLSRIKSELNDVMLIICDISLEGETVFDIVNYLKQIQFTAPLALITGNVPQSLVEPLKKLEYISILRKPFSMSELDNVIDIAAQQYSGTMPA